MTARLGGSTFSFMWQEPALNAMRRLRAIGLTEFDVITVPGHLWPPELSSADRSALAAALRRDDLKIESLNLPALDVNLASCTPEVRAFSVELYTAALQLSADLGGRGVVVVPGRTSALFPPPFEQSLSWLAEATEQLLRSADRLGQRIFLETHPLTSIPGAEAVAAFVKQFDHPLLSIAYDVANAEFIGEDQVWALRLLAPWLGQIHLSDGTRTHWRHDRAGTGSVKFAEVMLALDELSFQGLKVVELISTDPLHDFEATITHLKRF